MKYIVSLLIPFAGFVICVFLWRKKQMEDCRLCGSISFISLMLAAIIFLLFV